jgi:hypothetical protein
VNTELFRALEEVIVVVNTELYHGLKAVVVVVNHELVVIHCVGGFV